MGSCRNPSVPRPVPCSIHAEGRGNWDWAAILGARHVAGSSPPAFDGNTQERGGKAGASLSRSHPDRFQQPGTEGSCPTAATPCFGSGGEEQELAHGLHVVSETRR